MKYGYEGANPAEIIAKYEVDKVNNKKIIVTYLDGHDDNNFENTPQTQEELLAKMQQQAYSFIYENKTNDNNIKERLLGIAGRDLALWGIPYILGQSAQEAMAESSNKAMFAFNCLKTVAWAALSAYGMVKSLDDIYTYRKDLYQYIDKKRDKRKYEYYSEIEDVVDKMYYQEDKNDWLDWNTIDDYSMHEIKRIRRKCQK